jgi:hypothetical protein
VANATLAVTATSLAMTANVDAGDYQFRCKQGYFDVPNGTGSPPLVVDSADKVDNLNADKLDGYHLTLISSNSVFINANSNASISFNYAKIFVQFYLSYAMGAEVNYTILRVSPIQSVLQFHEVGGTDCTIYYDIFKISQ